MGHMRTRDFRVVIPLLAVPFLNGCADFTAADQGLAAAVPRNPVTGAPVLNLVSETDELQTASQRHAALVSVAQQQGLAFDPQNGRMRQLQRVFSSLLPVVHRRELPWQVHLIMDPTPNAFTNGGGYVYVFEGLFGGRGLVREGDDDELAAALAHEMAHVALLHVSLTTTWEHVSNRAKTDPYFHASFRTEQEAEADRLGILYMTLAGYDPRAAPRIWQRALQNLRISVIVNALIGIVNAPIGDREHGRGPAVL
jgi:predicted Zn-dependent protease